MDQCGMKYGPEVSFTLGRVETVLVESIENALIGSFSIRAQFRTDEDFKRYISRISPEILRMYREILADTPGDKPHPDSLYRIAMTKEPDL